VINRRQFFSALAAGVVVVATPLKLLAPARYVQVQAWASQWDEINFIIRRAFVAKLVASIAKDNVLFKALERNAYESSSRAVE
jgi:hypothetical protein